MDGKSAEQADLTRLQEVATWRLNHYGGVGGWMERVLRGRAGTGLQVVRDGLGLLLGEAVDDARLACRRRPP